MLTPDLLYELMNNSVAASGGTSHGVSADIKAIGCAMADAFSAQFERNPTVFPVQVLDASGKPKVVGHRAGSAFHALQELVRKGFIAASELPAKGACADTDAAVEAAIVAFRRYLDENKGDMDYLGTTIGIEYPIEGVVEGVKRTSRMDRIIEATEIHVDRWCELGIFTASPGFYLWDYKLLSAVSDDKIDKYVRSVQALMYMELYEQQTGIRPAGFVHELVSRAANPKKSRILTITHNTPAALPILKQVVRMAEERRTQGDCNATMCDSGYSACPFVKYCPRVGKVSDPDNQYALAQYKASRTNIPDALLEDE